MKSVRQVGFKPGEGSIGDTNGFHAVEKNGVVNSIECSTEVKEEKDGEGARVGGE